MSTTHFSEPQSLPDGSSVIYVTASTWRGNTRAVGMYTVTDGKTRWTPAADPNLVMLIGASTGFVAATLSLIAVLRRPPWPDMSYRTMAAIQAAKAAQHSSH